MDYSSAVKAIEEFSELKSLLISNFHQKQPFNGPLKYISKDDNIQILLLKNNDTHIVRPCQFNSLDSNHGNFDKISTDI